MVKKKNSLCENLGKLCLASVVACSAFVLIKTFLCKKENCDDYQERLRQAYEGLSPEEY
ncbi:MAG: hypothetical protein LBT18_00070 [Endomicrobium sp.]|jgi:uncharacterized cysteine cluster protein YcgN (CxxCxxCC family)|nr:hypothetical protein [Endomicrobium sp.]